MRVLALAVIAAVTVGCFSGDNLCRGDPCPAGAMPNPCEGQCAPFVGGGWSPVLVAEDGAAHCPAVAPFAALASDAPPMVACGVQEAPGACSSPGFVCLPSTLPPWTVCIVQYGEHVCPEPYPATLSADGVTVCCVVPADEPG